MIRAVVSGIFSEINSRLFRLMEEAGRIGPLDVVLWSDALAEALTGARPRFSLPEREYVLQSLRYVDRVHVVEHLGSADELPAFLDESAVWAMDAASDTAERRAFCAQRGLGFRAISEGELAGFPEREADAPDAGRRKILVTGCYDWFHSGHVRFFEEVAALGNLFVVVGHDANLRLLKGEGHPLFPEAERRYMAQSIRFVKQALISTGHGWMDAEPEIERLKPDAYAVNEDGDKPEKRAFCASHGLEYLVLKREPKPGLTRRTSTDLRGF